MSLPPVHTWTYHATTVELAIEPGTLVVNCAPRSAEAMEGVNVIRVRTRPGVLNLETGELSREVDYWYGHFAIQINDEEPRTGWWLIPAEKEPA